MCLARGGNIADPASVARTRRSRAKTEDDAPEPEPAPAAEEPTAPLETAPPPSETPTQEAPKRVLCEPCEGRGKLKDGSVCVGCNGTGLPR